MDNYQIQQVLDSLQAMAEYFRRQNQDYWELKNHQSRLVTELHDISNSLQMIEHRLEAFTTELIERAFINAQRDIMEKLNDTTEGVSRIH